MTADTAHFDTRCIHAGQEPDATSGAVMTPIVLATTFAQDGPGQHRGYDYSRAGNPTRSVLEACLASLEGAKHAIAFGSGCAAMTAVLMTLRAGDHVVVSDDVYGGTFRIFDRVLKQFELHARFVDMQDLAAVQAAITPQTKLLWLETPSNPLLKVLDIEALCKLGATKGVPSCVDNTFATPALQTPLDLGAMLVVHSCTKYLNGHSDVILGAVMTRDDAWAERLHFLQKATGGVPSPFDCYLLLRGLKTLHLRMARHVASATEAAGWLDAHPQVLRVYYPGLPLHPGYAVAQRQMRGPGGMLSFDLQGGAQAAAKFLQALKIFVCAESLGGVESLAELPAIMTHASIPAEVRRATGIGDGLLRLSVGVEDWGDLKRDLENGFKAAAALG
jgi:cystathionine gamma-lyase